MFLKCNNEKITGQEVCLFETEDDTKFIVLTDNTTNSKGQLNISAYYYEEIDNKKYLTPINEDDMELVDDAISMVKGEN